MGTVLGTFFASFSHFFGPQTSPKPPRNGFEIQTNFEAYLLTILAQFGGPQGDPEIVKNQQKCIPDASCGFPGPLGVLLGVPKALLETFLKLKPRVLRGFLKPDTPKPRVLHCFSEARHGETMRLRFAFGGFELHMQAPSKTQTNPIQQQLKNPTLQNLALMIRATRRRSIDR